MAIGLFGFVTKIFYIYTAVVCEFIVILVASAKTTSTEPANSNDCPNPNKIDRLTSSLERTLYYFRRHPEYVNVNFLLGAVIVEGQMKLAKEYDLSGQYENSFNAIIYLCDGIIQEGYKQNIYDIRYNTARRRLISPEMWSFDEKEKRLFGTYYYNHSEQQLPKFAATVVCHSPLMVDVVFDICLNYLLGNFRTLECCLKSALNTEAEDYVLTHQVIFLQVARQVNATRLLKGINYDNSIFIGAKCRQLYLQRLEMYLNNNKRRMTQNDADLFMEGILFCAIENYKEFFKPEWLMVALNSQTQDGYYQLDSSDSRNNEHSISDRTHFSSVSMATVAVFLKNILQQQKNVNYKEKIKLN